MPAVEKKETFKTTPTLSVRITDTLYIKHVVWHNKFITTAQSSNFLFVFSVVIGSSKCHDCISSHAHRGSMRSQFCHGFQPNCAAENFIFCSEALPGRLDEKQTVRCRLGTVQMTARDWKRHIHRWTNASVSQLLLRLVTCQICHEAEAGPHCGYNPLRLWQISFLIFIAVCFSVPLKLIFFFFSHVSHFLFRICLSLR